LLDFKRLRKQEVKELNWYPDTHSKDISVNNSRQSLSKEGNHYNYFRMVSKEDLVQIHIVFKMIYTEMNSSRRQNVRFKTKIKMKAKRKI